MFASISTLKSNIANAQCIVDRVRGACKEILESIASVETAKKKSQGLLKKQVRRWLSSDEIGVLIR